MRSVIITGSPLIMLTVDEIDRAILNLDPGGLLWHPPEWVEIVSGHEPGMDESAEAWALAKGKETYRDSVTPMDYEIYGRHLAPKMRNRRMTERADGALIFWDGLSGESADMCARMVARDKPVRVIPWARKWRIGTGLSMPRQTKKTRST
jgi:hypothetical protein